MDITSCSNTNYTVSVSVVDIGYTQLHSEYTTSTTEYDVYEELGIKVEDIINVTFVDNVEAYISINCVVNDLPNCLGYPPFIEQIESIIPSGIAFNRTVDIVDSCKHKGYYSFGPFSDRFIGIMTVVPVNNPEQTNSSEIRISTFHVQNFTLDVLSDTTVQLKCFFAVNSSADGCNVTFNSINQSVLVSVFIPKDNTIAVTNYTGIPEGDSVVDVYDVVEGVSNMSLPAMESQLYNISYPEPSETTKNGGTLIVVLSTMTNSLSTGTLVISPSVTMDTTIATNNALAIIIASVVGVVLITIIVTILIVVTIVAMKNSRKRNQVTLTQEMTLVRQIIAEPHVYTNDEDLRKPAVEGIYYEHRNNFLPPHNNSHIAGSNNTPRSPPLTYENANNLFAKKKCSDDISEDHVSIASEECVIESPVESTTDHTNGHLVMASDPPPVPLKTIKVSPGAKLDKSQYVVVGFTPNEEVDGVRTRPLPAMSQPQSLYATVKVQSSSLLSMETRPHNENSHIGDIHHAPVTTTCTVGSVDEHCALRGSNNNYNIVSEVTHHTLMTIQETSIPTESANIGEDHKSFVGYIQEQVYNYCEEALRDPVSKSQIIVKSWNESLEDIPYDLVYSLEKPIHYELEEINPAYETKCVDNNLEIHGISFAIDWKEIGLGFINFGASTVVDTLGSWLKRMICTYTSVVYNGSTSLPVFDVWLKRKIGLMCKSIDYGGRSLSLWKESKTAGWSPV